MFIQARRRKISFTEANGNLTITFLTFCNLQRMIKKFYFLISRLEVELINIEPPPTKMLLTERFTKRNITSGTNSS